MSDRMNNAYISYLFENTHILTGQQYMPFQIDLQKDVAKMTNLISLVIMALVLSLGMPNFLSHIVFEKENKLIDNMKTNGLKMSNYWVVNFTFSYFTYFLTVLFMIFYGRYVI